GVAAAPEPRRPLGARRPRQLFQGGGLADARLAFQQYHGAVAGAGIAQALAEARQLRRAADERRLGQERRRLVLLVRHLVRRDRCGETFELERADLGEPERLPPGQQTDDHVARENLTGVRLLTHPAPPYPPPPQLIPF